MSNKIFVYTLFCCCYFSCLGDKSIHCKQEIDAFLSTIALNDIEHLYGFSAESTWRKRDIDGNRSVYRISYINENRKIFEIPSFQKFDDLGVVSDSIYNLRDFVSAMGFDETNAEDITKRYVVDIIKVINKYDLKAIDSPKNKGDFMEFTLTTGCSVWYKKTDAKLSKKYEAAFQQAYNIAPNWYILKYTEELREVGKLY